MGLLNYKQIKKANQLISKGYVLTETYRKNIIKLKKGKLTILLLPNK